MKIENYSHIPVLLQEVIEILDPQKGQNFIDATLGGAGYSQEILRKVSATGNVLSIDLDQDALANAQELKSKQNPPAGGKNWIIAHGNFSHIDKIVENHKFPSPNGIVADLGLSSFQLDQSNRGFSFQKKELLDMRFDRSSDLPDARFILQNYDERRLRQIFWEFGEEKFSGKIAKEIIIEREKKTELKYTTDLYQLIQQALPKPVKHKASDSARRIFQALRIEVNHELENLETFLRKAFDLLNPSGRLVVVSFQSLEDRIVKKFFAELSKGCVCPPDFPQCVCGKSPKGRLLTKKLISASQQELEANARSKSAKLRAIQKT